MHCATCSQKNKTLEEVQRKLFTAHHIDRLLAASVIDNNSLQALVQHMVTILSAVHQQRERAIKQTGVIKVLK